jgi:Domain of Unknown Function (DUF1080)
MMCRLAVALGVLLLVVSSARAEEPAAAPNRGPQSGPPDWGANKLTAKEAKAGWKLLFDGKSTKGWRGYKQKTAPAAWVVKDGVLAFERQDGVQGGDLMTRDQYESFELSLDWRITEGGNSGIMYHVQETEDQPWKTGPEMQVLDNAKHRDGKNAITSAGSCYALYAPAKDVTRPVGEWNQARLVVNGANVEHWLNGEKIVSYEKGGEDWNAKVAASKFKAFPNFGKPTKGHIDLQDHGDRVEYRNIKLRVLRPVKTASN